MQVGAGDLFGGGGGNQTREVGLFSDRGFGGGMPSFGGSNQWMNFPALPNFNPSSSPNYQPVSLPGLRGNYTPGQGPYQGHGFYQNPTFDPQFTGSFYQMLTQLLSGAGGGLQNNLLSFLSGGPTSIPGADSLAEMSQTGDPISSLPEWQKMIEAQQRNIGENAANLREQFGFMGDLASSPFGRAESDFFQQTTKDQNALLAQLEQQALEQAMQRKLVASQDITGMAGAETQFLDQLFSQGALAQPGLHDKKHGSILGGIGSLLGGIGSFAGAASEAGGIGALLGGLI